MVDLVYCLTNLLLFDAPSLYYHINLRSSIIFCLSSRDIYLSLDTSSSCSLVIVSEVFCGELLQTFIILLAILLPIISPVASTIFRITFFEEVLNSSVADCLA